MSNQIHNSKTAFHLIACAQGETVDGQLCLASLRDELSPVEMAA